MESMSIFLIFIQKERKKCVTIYKKLRGFALVKSLEGQLPQ